MHRTHTNLSVCSLDPTSHARTCGYWYVVQESAGPHTAFATRAGFEKWMAERGLSLDGTLPDAPEWGFCRIAGSYRTHCHFTDADAFPGLGGLRSRTLSNGDYVEAIITTDADGVRTVHTLNPNVRDRRVFDYAESKALMS